MQFSELDIPDELKQALKRQGIIEATKIQADTYQPIVQRKDVIGISQTGSGKTIAYLLPMYQLIDHEIQGVQALILAPTQELASQIHRQIQQLSDSSESAIHSALLIGDGNMSRQVEALKSKPQIVVGTCGRILQLIRIKKLSVHTVKTFIIDEFDKMFDKKNRDSVLQIRKSLLKYTQVLLFSASTDKKALEYTSLICQEPVVIHSQQDSKIPDTIRHYFIVTERKERTETLRSVIQALKPAKSVIFINKVYDALECTQKLEYHHYKVGNMVGTHNKLDRKNTINAFKSGKLQYVVATDIAARGLQINGIDVVVNMNLPEDPKEYLHRAGRCGRNGKKGICISIITAHEVEKIKTYQKLFDINIIEKKLFKGQLVAK